MGKMGVYGVFAVGTMFFHEKGEEKAEGGYTVTSRIRAVLRILARYVEGYALTRPQTGRINGNTVTLTGKNAHAWMEVYVDGIGWRAVFSVFRAAFVWGGKTVMEMAME